MSEPNWKEMYREEKEINEWYVTRIETLQAALREIKDQYLTPDQSSAIARVALEQAT